MIAANSIRGDAPLAQWDQVDSKQNFLLDVRNPEEYKKDGIPGVLNIPLNQLRSEIKRLPKDRVIYIYCGVGQRAYYATRMLRSNGFDARNISGGIQTYNSRRV